MNEHKVYTKKQQTTCHTYSYSIIKIHYYNYYYYHCCLGYTRQTNTTYYSIIRSVFPCGDEMVAIMDDRGDVWGHRPNLIHVKAYVFFAGTDDINAPPLPTPTHPPTAPPTHPPTAPPTHPPTAPPTHPPPPPPPPTAPPTHPPPTAPPTHLPPPTVPPTSTVPPQGEDHHSNVSSLPSNSNSNNNTDKGGNGNGNKDGKNKQTEGATGNTTSTTSTPPVSLTSTTTNTTATATPPPPPPPSGAAGGSAAASGSSGEGRGQTNSGKDATSPSLPSSSTVNEDRATRTTGIVHDGSANNETVSGSDDAMVVSTTDDPSSSSSIPPGDESHHLADYNVSSSSSSSSSSDSSDDDEEEESMDTTPSSLAQSQPQPAPEPSPPDTAMEIHAKPRPVINDPDKFLVYLQDLLERIHETFYKEYDEMKREEEKEGKGGRGGGSESLSSPDLKVIIPSLRKSVFSGLRLLFTGIIPTNMNPEKSREWNTTRAFGGEIHSTLVTTPSPDDEHTTHVIAGKKDTDKYKQALRIPRIEIVGPEWFWDCAERWKRLDEDEYRLDGERKAGLKQETSQTKLKDDKKINDVRRRKGRREEEGDSKGKRKMTPPRQKAKLRHDTTTPPFDRKFSVSSAELELMEAEIDAELETDDDEDDDDERIGSYIQPVKDEEGDSFNAYLGLEEPSHSRSSSRKRKRVPDNDPCSSDSVSDSTSDDSDDELSALLEFT